MLLESRLTRAASGKGLGEYLTVPRGRHQSSKSRARMCQRDVVNQTCANDKERWNTAITEHYEKSLSDQEIAKGFRGSLSFEEASRV